MKGKTVIMKLSTIIPIAILFDSSSMVAGKSTFKEKQRTNRDKTIHYNPPSSRKLKKTTKVVKDHITYIETGATQTIQGNASKKSSNQTAKTPKSMFSALVDLEETAAQMENTNHNTMAPSTAKHPKSNTDTVGTVTGAAKSGKAYYAGGDEGDMPTSGKTQKSAASYDAADTVTGTPKSGKAYYAGADEGDIPTSGKTQKSAANNDAGYAVTGPPKSGKAYYAGDMPTSGKTQKSAANNDAEDTVTGPPKSGKAYYAGADKGDMPTAGKTQKSAANNDAEDAVTGPPKSGKAYYAGADEGDMPTSGKTQKSAANNDAGDAVTGPPKSGKAYNATGAPKSGKAYYPDGDEDDMPSTSKSQKSSTDGTGKSAKAFMYKKTKTVKDYGSRTDAPKFDYYYKTAVPSLTPSVSPVPSSLNDTDPPSESTTAASSAPSITEIPSATPSKSLAPSLSSSPSKIPSTSPVPSLSSAPSEIPSEGTSDDPEIE